jgi:hypothetical protein
MTQNSGNAQLEAPVATLPRCSTENGAFPELQYFGSFLWRIEMLTE